MEDISLHILDIVENSLTAGAKNIGITVKEDIGRDLLTVRIADDGRGMSAKKKRMALDPFFTTKESKKIGLGLPLLAQACREAEGDLRLCSNPSEGTKVLATFKYSHIDRRPLGNIAETLLTLIFSHPEINFSYSHRKGRRHFSFGSLTIKGRFKEKDLLDPFVYKKAREGLEKAFARIGGGYR